jgi:uncharacterized membrane protein
MISVEINNDFFNEAGTQVLFILMILVIWFTLVYLSLRNHGWRRTLRYFLPMIIASLFLEAYAVANGRYSYPDYLVYVYVNVLNASVPLIILLGWSVNLFLFLSLSEYIVSLIYSKMNHLRILLVALSTGLTGVCLDLLEDPVAHHNNWWVWVNKSSSITLHGVPLSNFIDWFLILFFMSLTTLLIDHSRLSENRKVLLSIISVSYTGAVIFVFHYILIELTLL